MGKHAASGFIYMMTNPSMPNRVKIGLTTDLERRRKELSKPTAIPEPFSIYRAFSVNNMELAEKICHECLSSIRVNSRREFFDIQNSPYDVEYECPDTGIVFEDKVYPLDDLSDFIEEAMFKYGVDVEFLF